MEGAGNDEGKVVVIVVTNHDKLGNTGKQTGWYLPEVAHPHKVFVDNGYQVVFVSPKGGKAPVDEGSVTAFKDDPVSTDFLKNDKVTAELQNTKSPSQIDPSKVQAIFYAGGHGPMFDLPEDEQVAKLATAIYENGGVVGAVCHGPVGLVPVKLSSGEYLLKDKVVTSFTNSEEAAVNLTEAMPFLLEDKLKERGATFRCTENWGRHVEVSDRVVTGQNPASATATAEAIVSLLKKKKQTQGSLCCTRMVKTLLVVECSAHLNWYNVFEGAVLHHHRGEEAEHDVEGEEIRVEQAEWDDLTVVSYDDSGVIVTMRRAKKPLEGTTQETERTVKVDFVLLRSVTRGIKGQDSRTKLFTLMHGNVPSVNSLESAYFCLERPLVFGQLKAIQKKLGKEEFPLIPQTLYSSHRDMIIAPDCPLVGKVGHAHAGYGKMRVKDMGEFQDFRSLCALHGDYVSVEVYATSLSSCSFLTMVAAAIYRLGLGWTGSKDRTTLQSLSSHFAKLERECWQHERHRGHGTHSPLQAMDRRMRSALWRS
ncbi:Type 1 glutamine amidotransferase domain-containing protein [Balamuthia mandrillaris]